MIRNCDVSVFVSKTTLCSFYNFSQNLFNQGTDIIIKAFLKDVHRRLNSVSNYQDHQILPLYLNTTFIYTYICICIEMTKSVQI